MVAYIGQFGANNDVMMGLMAGDQGNDDGVWVLIVIWILGLAAEIKWQLEWNLDTSMNQNKDYKMLTNEVPHLHLL